ncbi:MAG: alpha-amylase family glycosyl hydrolase [Thermoleophilia bacterium]
MREWAIQNACQWVRDFHVDGLRLDAVHAIEDDSPRHVLAELADRVRAERPGTLVISEMETGDLRPLRDWGHDAQWADELHHALHVLLTGEREGYYADYGRVADVAAALTRPEGRRLVVCTQNHDQVGNRALGDRPPPGSRRLAAMLTLLAPGTPLLFMGEEHGERRPFRFFTDHDDPFIADATREGRRREFAGFAGFRAEDVPDPQAEETFLASRLDRAAGDPALRALYRDLLALRRRLGDAPASVDLAEDERWLVLRRGGVEVLANLADREQAVGGETLRPFEGRIRHR